MNTRRPSHAGVPEACEAFAFPFVSKPPRWTVVCQRCLPVCRSKQRSIVRHLPHQLVEAFRSTLEEVGEADLVLHVVDGSHPDPLGQLAAVREVLAEIEADHVPELVVVNKSDLTDAATLAGIRRAVPDAVA